jgi:Mrp family chromosome partitioning ATPase
MSARRGDAAAELARALASHRASQDVRALVVDATPSIAGRVGLAHTSLAAVIADRDVVALDEVMASGGKLDPERVEAALEELRGLVDLVVVVVPSMLDDGAGQAICAAADQTVIVVERGVSRSDDVVAAVRLVEDVSGRLLGAVIVPPRGSRLSRAERRASAAAAAPRKREVERPAVTVDEPAPSAVQFEKQSSLR